MKRQLLTAGCQQRAKRAVYLEVCREFLIPSQAAPVESGIKRGGPPPLQHEHDAAPWFDLCTKMCFRVTSNQNLTRNLDAISFAL